MIKGGRGVVRIEMLRHRIAPLMVLDNPERIPDVAVAHPHSILSPGPIGASNEVWPETPSHFRQPPVERLGHWVPATGVGTTVSGWQRRCVPPPHTLDRKSTRLNSSH